MGPTQKELEQKVADARELLEAERQTMRYYVTLFEQNPRGINAEEHAIGALRNYRRAAEKVAHAEYELRRRGMALRTRL